MPLRAGFKYTSSKLISQQSAALTTTISGILAAGSLQAATITVTTLDDGFIDGQCSLRSAISAANSNAASNDCNAGSANEVDQIRFASGLSGPLQLQAGIPVQGFWDGSQLQVRESLSIVGPTNNVAANTIQIRGTGAAPVFYAAAQTDQLSLQNLTITGGYSPEDLPDRLGHGGGILSYGRLLSLDGVMLSSNGAARGGGGVWHSPDQNEGVLIATNCQFTSNSAGAINPSFGGGMAVLESVVSINNCSFVGNEIETGDGGGLAILDSALTGVVDSYFLSNTAPNGEGGGVAIQSAQAQAYLAGNLFDRNQALSRGGGLMFFQEAQGEPDDADIQMVENTFSDNLSGFEGGGLSIDAGPGQLTFIGGQITGNQAQNSAGGAELLLNGTDLSWQGTYLGNNIASGPPGGGGLSVRATASELDFNRFGSFRNIAEDGCGGGLKVAPLIGLNGPETLMIKDSILLGNQADCGGALDLFMPASNPIQVLLQNNEWSGNRALGERLNGQGGALFFDPGDDSLLILSNSTLSGNQAAVSGGGIFAADGTQLSIKYSTLAHNQASGYGRDVMSNGQDCVIRNSIMASTSASAIDGSAPCTLNHSLIENSSSSVIQLGESVLVGADPMLGPLNDNGNTLWSWTHRPEPGSPVIDAGSASISAPSFDQRGGGFPRLNGPALDLGALETPAALSDRLFSDRFADEN